MATTGIEKRSGLNPEPVDALQGASEPRYEKLYKMLMDTIPSSVLLIDQHLRILTANRNFLEKARRSEHDTIGKRLDEVFPTVILEEMQMERRIQQVLQRNAAVRGERMTYRTPGVPLRIYYYSVIPVSWTGRVEDVMLLMDDITEQIRLSEEIRRAERHLASVVESASDIVVSTDPEGRIVTWNIAAEKITGYLFREVRDRFFFEFFVLEQQPLVKEALKRIESLENLMPAEWNLTTKQGHEVPVSWVCSTMKDDLGRVVGVVGVGRDLTERRKFEAQIVQSQKLAALGVMAGGIAHEIRNPLGVSAAAAQLLLDNLSDRGFVKECAEKIHKGIQRASYIIEGLLKFARPSVAKDLVPVDIRSVVKDTLDIVANEAKLQKIEITTRIPETPLVITGVANLLQQVFMNLFLNAFNAMPNGGSLHITLDQKDRETLVQVRDYGIGISKEDMDKIFDPFYTTMQVGQGTGLGLSLCYSIVREHGGVVEVESAEGKGSTFTVRFPLSPGT